MSSSEPRTAEAGLLILADLAGYSTDHMRPHLTGLHPLLANSLNSPSTDVQVRDGRLQGWGGVGWAGGQQLVRVKAKGGGSSPGSGGLLTWGRRACR